MNVDDYLKRINYKGSKEPNLENLKAIIQAHKINLAYSNLRLHGADDDNKIQLDLKKIYNHVVTRNGGGMCYELNALFVWALQQLGYDACYSHSGVYIPGQGLSREDLHMNPVIKIDGSRYFVDPGFYQFGVAEIKHMVAVVTPFNVFRFKVYPKENGEKEIIFERHLKTVLDAEGNYLKKGPSTIGYNSCSKTEDCQKEDSTHWVKYINFNTTPRKLEDFENVWDFLQTCPLSDLLRRVILIRYDLEPVPVLHSVFGECYERKEAVDPIIDKIAVTRKLRTNEDVENVVEEIFHFNITHPVKYFKEN